MVRIVLDHLGGVCGGTNYLRSSWWGLWWYESSQISLVGFVLLGGTNSLNHLGGVCGGTNSLRSSWWGLWWYE